MSPIESSARNAFVSHVLGGDGDMTPNTETFEAWDPIEPTAVADPGILIGAQRREIGNILRNDTRYLDPFSELVHAFDAIILNDLVRYLMYPNAETTRQRFLAGEETV
jgi:hypothetical protein